MKHALSFGALTVIGLSLASCSPAAQDRTLVATNSPSAQQELPTELLLSEAGKKAVVLLGPSSAPRQGAQLKGRIDNDDAGCFILEAEDGDDYTLVFPEGTKFDGESVVFPGTSPLSEGATVAVEGVRVPANESLSMCLNYARLLSVEAATVVAS